MLCSAQAAFQNFGDIQLHNNAKIGFHTDLINNGTFNNNKGLTGFYSDDITRVVTGNNMPVFYDVDINTYNDLELQISMGVTNELSFINGKILTDKNDLSVSLNFINHNFYAGEDDDRYVDGYSQVEGLNEFTFPIGDDNRIRPMILPEQNQNTTFKGAYFYEDPNAPITFSTSFLTDQKQVFIENINTNEFWDLDGATETTITLTWDVFSNIPGMTENIENLRVVGWSSVINKWVDLGRIAVSGSVTKGQVTSNNFIPDNYDVITIGSNFSDGNLDNVNIIFTPNGDTTNETLVFESLDQYKKNTLEVYNRWGNIVYKKTNYKNNWNGKSFGRATIKANNDLPVGTYFYRLRFGDDSLSKIQRGWVYIHR
ncbi:gliding motility-associated C-terminal domain-containing protein [Tenacibaculum sp. HL-MS23]|uniref:gliding motility-associated C-terminal domain-containing protein n=1 Tax=unclassified Tenacibaculum TaxID=2635139 RepID=UPI001C4E35E0|nr:MULTISPECIES: gliding motility-associated C-terminal domain-containing protein [unclassified Tenacibaculum]QXP74641.1 gliding motility-associated C-terminal domain-containing protein [Tenacibaculum sp. AHE14PA]QXP76152.1 gliding motility-associated C-terminal domain-containing protein [Tenacibaculum sp. AHE15PA]WNW02729.1 gliding motility-associated C-terminal domain-containing protein [Tenacibaculum sp. HL-MS23]